MSDVYVLRNKAHDLLYVGRSLSLAHRLAVHRRDKEWWSDVALIEVEHCVDQDHAIDREAFLIRNMSPRHNRVLNASPVACGHGPTIPDPVDEFRAKFDDEDAEAREAIKAAWAKHFDEGESNV